MKKVFFTIALTASSLGIFAGVPKNDEVKTKSISLTKTFNKVSVGQNLNVEFSNGANGSVRLEGNNSFLNEVNLQVINETLFVSLKGDAKFKGTVYLPVGNLTEIEVDANAKVCSHEFLNCSNLIVWIADGARAALKTRGAIGFKSIGESSLDYEKFISITE